ncbi:hypothetical protein P879_00315 [Paragonimus westermani]|uniref:p53 DNA-binding domain-containing protein n=1 Tax=Paragonimus westermani TaxID=34504 RepID=A0A8T0DTA1_9TREM|nr:hypothetical protein P879_00315 [Paragonimus westermani]
MEHVLPMATESDHPICSSGGGVQLLHPAVRPFEATSFPEHISQLLSGVHTTCTNESVVPTTSLHATERARTGLAFAMDLIRMPNNEYVVPYCKQESATTPTRSVSRNALACSPTVTSTPGTFSRLPTRFNLSPTVYTDPESNATLRVEPVMDTAMPPKKLTSDDIPVLDSFPGYYGFDLYRPLCGDAYEATETKPSTAYFYFKDDQGWTNLYAKKTPTWWTLSYWCQRQPPEGSFIRLTPVYGTSDKQQEVIQRCFEDFMAMPTNSMARYSIVVVGNSLADYFFDPVTERLCVTLPYEKPKEGCEYSQFNGKFMCFNSCLYNGGQGNKKPLFLIITLERLVTGTDQTKGQCEVLGRQCIKFRSCACPKRDKENSERRTGDSTVYNPCTLSGKRRKESERTERQNKKLRVQNQEFIASTNSKATGSRQTTNCSSWGSPTQDQANHETQSNSLDGGMDTRNGDLFVDSEVGGQSTIVHFNGESYHLLLVPTGLPGGIETLSGVRFGLIRTWLHPSSRSASKQSYLLGPEVLKPDIDAEKKLTVKTNDPEESYRTTLISSRMDVDNTLHQLSIVETQLASVLRERMLQSGQFQRIYHYGGDSTDSQPNSADAVGLGVGSIDESGNLAHEFPTACGVGPLSSDSGISTDMVHQQQRHQQQSHQQPPAQDRLTSLGLLQQTQLINDIFPVPPAAHRSSLPISSVNLNQPGAYDVDYSTRFSALSNNHIYMPPTSSANLRSSIGFAYPSDLMETYALVQQQVSASVPEATMLMDHQSVGKTLPAPPRITVSVSELNPLINTSSNTLSANLNHALSSSAFYPPQYFSTRSSVSDQIPTILETFPRGHLGGTTVSASSGTHAHNCFYPTVGNGTIPESLLLPEEVLSNYLEREKGYDETDGANPNLIRHSVRHSPSYNSSSPRSTSSTCREKLVVLDV